MSIKADQNFDVKNDLQRLLPTELYSALMGRFSFSDQKINELVGRQNPEQKIVINNIKGPSITCQIVGRHSHIDKLIYIEGRTPTQVLKEIDDSFSLCDDPTLRFTDFSHPRNEDHGIPDDPWEMKLNDSDFSIGLDVPMENELTRIIGISIDKTECIAYICVAGGYGEFSAAGIEDERVEASINAIDGLSYYGEDSGCLAVQCDKSYPFSQLMSKLNACLEQLLPTQE